METPEEIKRRYYERMASQYDCMHVHRGDEHYKASEFINGFAHQIKIRTFLDVGLGTGRALEYLNERGFKAVGIEPSLPLIHEALRKKSIRSNQVISATGETLPFKDGSFDAACAFALLHHVERPDLVVKEMLRVSNKAIFISDSNRFGQGRPWLRLAKLLLYKTHLWRIANFVKTGGKGYAISEGDGLSYSYSVFDSINTINPWAKDVFLIPTKVDKKISWCHPLLTSSSILLCAVRQ